MEQGKHALPANSTLQLPGMTASRRYGLKRQARASGNQRLATSHHPLPTALRPALQLWHSPGRPPVASVVVRVASTADTLASLTRCSTQNRWKPSPALNRKRWRSKNSSTEGTEQPVSAPTPSTCGGGQQTAGCGDTHWCDAGV